MGPLSSSWGASWLGSWGDSWGPLHTVEEGRRPRTHPNVKFTGIREGRAAIRGAEVAAKAGRVYVRGTVVTIEPYVFAGVSAVRGSASSARNGKPRGCGAANTTLVGSQGRAKVGTVKGRAAAVHRVRGACLSVRTGSCSSAGGGRALVSSEEVEAFVGSATAKGIQNPTDEQLLFITHLLTCK